MAAICKISIYNIFDFLRLLSKMLFSEANVQNFINLTFNGERFEAKGKLTYKIIALI